MEFVKESVLGGGAIGAADYYNLVTEMYLYKTTTAWTIRPVCGAMASKAYGKAGNYPFLNMASSWQCVYWTTFVDRSVDITCSLYFNQPCKSGTFSPTGLAPYSDRENDCPAILPHSPEGNQLTCHLTHTCIMSFTTNSVPQKGPPQSPSASPFTTTSPPCL